ncbi:flagellar hook-basal body complex protein FliE [Ferroacidibacillus organovorans]|nr:flagellar hook-basal body complex protein FliE [Ferroacidibacillus organovorans]
MMATPALATPAAANGGTSFSQMLTSALQGVNTSVAQSQSQGLALAAGTAPNLSNVMVSATQAQLALDLTVQVRNRAVSAYNQLMSMQV